MSTPTNTPPPLPPFTPSLVPPSLQCVGWKHFEYQGKKYFVMNWQGLQNNHHYELQSSLDLKVWVDRVGLLWIGSETDFWDITVPSGAEKEFFRMADRGLS